MIYFFFLKAFFFYILLILFDKIIKNMIKFKLKFFCFEIKNILFFYFSKLNNIIKKN